MAVGAGTDKFWWLCEECSDAEEQVMWRYWMHQVCPDCGSAPNLPHEIATSQMHSSICASPRLQQRTAGAPDSPVPDSPLRTPAPESASHSPGMPNDTETPEFSVKTSGKRHASGGVDCELRAVKKPMMDIAEEKPSQSVASRPSLFPYTVTLDRSNADSLGFTVERDSEKWCILQVTGGLVRTWNEQHQSKAVSSGDRFVSVNGIRDISRFAEELQKRTTLSIQFLSMRFKSAGLDAMLKLEPKDALHFDRSSESRKTMKIVNISDRTVTLKVKTDAPKALLFPEGYQWELQPGESCDVKIAHQPDHKAATGKPRLLVQAVAKTEEISKLKWAEFPKELIKEHYLDVFIEDCPDEVVVNSEALLELHPETAMHFCDSAKSTETLRLTNTSASSVAFRVKTTAPRSYMVCPELGCLKPGDSSNVSITFRRHHGTRTLGHLFMVQSCAVNTYEEVTRDFWAALPETWIQKHELGVVIDDSPDEVRPSVEEADDLRVGDTLQALHDHLPIWEKDHYGAGDIGVVIGIGVDDKGFEGQFDIRWQHSGVVSNLEIASRFSRFKVVEKA